MNILQRLRLERFDSWSVVKVIIFLFVVVFLLYPLYGLFKGSFLDVETGGFTLANYYKFFGTPKYYDSMVNSFIITSVTAVGTLIIGIALAYIMTRFIIKGQTFLNVLIVISLLSPPFIGAYSWILLLGNNGSVRLFFETFGIDFPTIYSMSGILIVFVLKLFPFIYLYASGALQSIDASLIEASEGLGSGKWRRMYSITIPLIMPTLLSGALLVSMTAFADFGTPLLLGRGVTTLPVIIYDEFVSELGGNSYFASAIGVVIIIFATLLFLGQRYIVNRKSFEMSSLRPVAPKNLTGIINFFAHGLVYGVVFLATLPQLTVAYYSFKKTSGPVFQDGFSLDSYRNVLAKLNTEIINTFLYSFLALLIMLILALGVSYLSVRRKNFSSTLLDISIMLPYIIPGTVVGIMYAVTFNSGPIVITGTSLILIIAYAVRRGPNVVRSSTGILYQISPSVEEASISLGVSPLKSFFKITAVLMLPGIISGGLLAWVRTTSELSVSIMLYVGKTRTMPVATYSEIIYGRFGNAAALSTLLILIIAVILTIFFRITKKTGQSMV